MFEWNYRARIGRGAIGVCERVSLGHLGGAQHRALALHTAHRDGRHWEGGTDGTALSGFAQSKCASPVNVSLTIPVVKSSVALLSPPACRLA